MGNIYRISGIKDATIVESTGDTVDIPYGNVITVGPEFETITYEGDGVQQNDYYGLRVGGTIGGDKWSEDVLEALYSKTAATSGTGIDDVESTRYYMGDNAELAPTQVGLRVDFSAINDSTEAAATIRMTVFKTRVAPFVPPEGANAAKFAPLSFTWTAEKTSTDIEGNALPGVPTGGAFYAISVLS